MKAKIRINKKLSIVEGHENWGDKIIDFSIADLTKEQRQELITFYTIDEGYDLTDTNYEIGKETPEIDDIKNIIEKRIGDKITKDKNEYYSLVDQIKKGTIIDASYNGKWNKYYLVGFYKGHKKIDELLELFKNDSLITKRINELNELAKEDSITSEQEYYEKKEKSEKMSKELKEYKEKKEGKKSEWINNNGSERLLKGLNAGYNIGRLYVEERSQLELKKYGHVFFDSKEKFEIKERNNPSLEMLNLEKKIKKDGYECKIVWCIEPVDRDCYDEEPEQYESIRITFLDTYDIYIK